LREPASQNGNRQGVRVNLFVRLIMDYVSVFEGSNPNEAQMVFQLLRSNDFHPWMPGGHEHTYVQLDTDVQVPADEADAARELLSAYEASPDEGESDSESDAASG